MGSDFLFVQPSFLRGVARVIDLGGTMNRGAYNTSASPIEADTKALLSDWQALAQDVGDAFARTSELVERERREALR